MDAKLAELLVLGVFHLSIHPNIEFVAVVTRILLLLRIIWWSVILALTGNYNFRKSFQLSVGCSDDWPDCKCSSSQFLRWNGFVIVVHEIDMPFVGHSRFKHGRFSSTELEFQLGSNDSSFDETIASFTFEMMIQRHGYADDPSGQTTNTDGPLHFLQLDIVSEIISLKMGRIIINISRFILKY